MATRREFIAASATAALAPGAAAVRPNFIVFLTDDHGYHDLGCQGAADMKTPNIDALAASGARFTNWYSNAPMCAPSRAALLTGRYPIRAGVPSNGPPLPVTEQTIASLLKAQRYATALTGKWHLGSTPETGPNARGFDYFYGFHSGCIDFYSHRYYWGEPRTVNYHDLWRNRTEIFEDGQYMTELITREAKAFLTANRSKPFFLYVPYNAPHYPMHAPRKYVERFAGLEPERQMYAAMVAAVDDSVGEIMTLVKRFGLAENTLVFFSSDNGATREPRAGLNQQPARGGSNRPFRGFKFSLFDGGMHQPAIMSWPGRIRPGQVIGEVCAHIDLLPTIVNAAGAAVPADRTIDGRDVLPVAAAGAKSPHEALFWSSGGQLAVRRGRWKLVKDGRLADQKLTGEDALFLSDLEEDPGESRNRRRDHPALVDELLTLAMKFGDRLRFH
ncbi:MAG: sulfatase-like hydrolase/transferase [Acidobacteriota bacterium]